jgi:hypothetical protein
MESPIPFPTEKQQISHKMMSVIPIGDLKQWIGIRCTRVLLHGKILNLQL